MSIDKVLYTAKAHTTGGRDGGASQTDDGRLDVKLSSPGTRAGTNPEQLFAAGWSACFLSAIKLVAGKKKVTLPADVAVDAEVDLGTDGVFGLAARLNVSLPGLDREAARALVDAAHQVCPYSNATRGNIDVAINVVTTIEVHTLGSVLIPCGSRQLADNKERGDEAPKDPDAGSGRWCGRGCARRLGRQASSPRRTRRMTSTPCRCRVGSRSPSSGDTNAGRSSPSVTLASR